MILNANTRGEPVKTNSVLVLLAGSMTRRRSTGYVRYLLLSIARIIVLVALSSTPVASQTTARPGLVLEESVYKSAPFPSCHCATVVDPAKLQTVPMHESQWPIEGPASLVALLASQKESNADMGN